MKKYRRLEITAFRRRVTIVSGDASANKTESSEEVCINDAETNEAIEPESAEGQRVLLEAVHLLQEKLSDRTKKDT